MGASLIFDSERRIDGGGITVIPDLTIRETHRDSLNITSHPIQTGAAITDHSYLAQAEFMLEYGWSNSNTRSSNEDYTGQPPTEDHDESYIKKLYETVVSLQASRALCTVITGKRRYTNVLIRSVETMTTNEMSHSMIIQMNCASITLAQTTRTVAGDVKRDNQADPSKTAPQTNNGTKQLQQPSDDKLFKSTLDDAERIL